MGGSGSGRCSYSKATTSDYHQLDIRSWRREGLLVAGRSLVWPGGSTYPVRLDWTPCNYGGSRAWFICPARDCGRRVAILYGDGPFACRQCRQLAYDSQQDSGWRRSIRQARAARMKLGGSASLAEPLPAKPKGMHQRTYSRLYIRAAGREQAFLAGTLTMLTTLEQQIFRFKVRRRSQ
jgi:hypothetical protein